jgi:hypothetical protein
VRQVLSIFLAIFLTSCTDTGNILQNYQRSLRQGDIAAIAAFATESDDQLGQDERIFLTFILGKSNRQSLAMLPQHPGHSLKMAEMALLHELFTVQFRAMEFLFLTRPLYVSSNQSDVLNAGFYAKTDSLRFLAYAYAKMFPPEQTELMYDQVEMFLTKRRELLDRHTAAQLGNRFSIGLRDTLTNPFTGKVDGIAIIDTSNIPFWSLPPLHLWEHFTAMEKDNFIRVIASRNFPSADRRLGPLIWAGLQFHQLRFNEVFPAENIEQLFAKSGQAMQMTIISGLKTMLDDSSYVSFLMSIVDSEEELPQVRRKAIESLPDDPGIDNLLRIMAKLNVHFYHNASLRLLLRTDNRAFDAYLIGQLQREDDEKLDTYIYLSGFRKLEAALPLLKRYKQDSRETIRFNAKEAIRRISKAS